ncbi:hypothetical protein Sjap_020508 [Stephania japonica]|uniref:RNase H type-1 domain-containing protein n=1 Tax=Stephania japonica TaxID=461633 RepID=A0AAP0F9S1_9MAGN
MSNSEKEGPRACLRHHAKAKTNEPWSGHPEPVELDPEPRLITQRAWTRSGTTRHSPCPLEKHGTRSLKRGRPSRVMCVLWLPPELFLFKLNVDVDVDVRDDIFGCGIGGVVRDVEGSVHDALSLYVIGLYMTKKCRDGCYQKGSYFFIANGFQIFVVEGDASRVIKVIEDRTKHDTHRNLIMDICDIMRDVGCKCVYTPRKLNSVAHILAVGTSSLLQEILLYMDRFVGINGFTPKPYGGQFQLAGKKSIEALPTEWGMEREFDFERIAGMETFQEAYPALYHITRKQRAFIAEFVQDGEEVGWNLHPEVEWPEMKLVNMDPSEEYSMKSTYEAITLTNREDIQQAFQTM